MTNPFEMLVALGCTGIVFGSLTKIVVSVINRPRATSLTPDIDARLARIEGAMDAIAVEVERISEGQRFTTRLLGERGGAVSPNDAR